MKLKNYSSNIYIKDSNLNQNSYELGVLVDIDNMEYYLHIDDNFSGCTFLLFGLKPFTGVYQDLEDF